MILYKLRYYCLIRDDSMFKMALQENHPACQTKRDECNQSIIEYVRFPSFTIRLSYFAAWQKLAGEAPQSPMWQWMPGCRINTKAILGHNYP